MEIEEAVELLLSDISPITDEITVPLEEAYGHIMPADFKADSPIPPFARSAMDGYAVRSEDIKGGTPETPVKLDVVGEILAGDCKDLSYTPHSAVRVMTGGMIPDGYDAVVRQEDTDMGEESVLIYTAIAPFTNYCHRGEEAGAGEVLIPAGGYIGRTETGLIASCGKESVSVRRPVSVGIVSTGSELVKPGEALDPGKIYGSVRYMLFAAIKSDGFDVAYSVDCPDDEEKIEEHIRAAAACSDVVITTGGVSVGKKDLVAGVYSKIGAKKVVSRVNIQPGTPTLISIFEGRILIGLSGNPYAALANFDLYFPHIASKLMGSSHYKPEVSRAILGDPYEKINKMRRLVRAYEKEGKVYLPVKAHMSSVFGNMDKCNCYIDIPAASKLSVGDIVNIRRMRYR